MSCRLSFPRLPDTLITPGRTAGLRWPGISLDAETPRTGASLQRVTRAFPLTRAGTLACRKRRIRKVQASAPRLDADLVDASITRAVARRYLPGRNRHQGEQTTHLRHCRAQIAKHEPLVAYWVPRHG